MLLGLGLGVLGATAWIAATAFLATLGFFI
ncbi:MAG: hypothetical protein JWN03_1042 [Nocardia sp.]|nr:hypothetical protein [Nocardia sp.]